MQPTPTAFQPQPHPVAPPPTIPDEHYDRVEGDEIPIDIDVEGDRSSRRRAIFARVVGVLLILMTAGLAFVTVGRAWVGSLPSVIWPSSLQRPEQPSLPSPFRPGDDEPVRPAAPAAPPLVPPMETLPVAPATTASPVETDAPPAEAAPRLPAPTPAVVEKKPRSQSPRRPVQRETSEAVPPPADPSPPVEAEPDRGMTPEELPARPTVDPASPEAPPAGEAPAFPQNESNTVFGDE